MSCGVGLRCGSDLVLLWLWYRPAAAAPIQPLAGNFHMLWKQTLPPAKKKKERKRNRKLLLKWSGITVVMEALT